MFSAIGAVRIRTSSGDGGVLRWEPPPSGVACSEPLKSEEQRLWLACRLIGRLPGAWRLTMRLTDRLPCRLPPADVDASDFSETACAKDAVMSMLLGMRGTRSTCDNDRASALTRVEEIESESLRGMDIKERLGVLSMASSANRDDTSRVERKELSRAGLESSEAVVELPEVALSRSDFCRRVWNVPTDDWRWGPIRQSGVSRGASWRRDVS